MAKSKFFCGDLYQKMSDDLHLAGMRKRTHDGYLREIRKLADHYQLSPDALSEHQLRRYFLYAKNEKHYAEGSLSVTLSAFKFFFRVTCPRDWDTIGQLRVKGPKTLPEVITIPQVHRIIDTCTTERMAVFFWTVYSMGLRLSEALHLQVGDIDAARGMVHVHRGKGAKDRYIPLPTSTLQWLRQHWLTHRHRRFLFPADGRDHKGMSKARTPMAPTTPQDAMKLITNKIDFGKKVCTHTLREVLSPAGIELSLQVIEDEQQRRQQLNQLYADRVAQARYASDLAERRYQNVDPANRLVASRLEADWESSLGQLGHATHELEELRSRESIVLDETEKQCIQSAASDISALWQERATIKDRKELTRLLIESVEMAVRGESQHVDVRVLWRGGFESCHHVVRTVATFSQWDGYDEVMNRILALTLEGKQAGEVAAALEADGFLSPRLGKPLSVNMIREMIRLDQRCQQQLNDPELGDDQWRLDELAGQLSIREERLKGWVVKGWINSVQRPYGRTWVVWADAGELERLRQRRKAGVAKAVNRNRKPCPRTP